MHFQNYFVYSQVYYEKKKGLTKEYRENDSLVEFKNPREKLGANGEH